MAYACELGTGQRIYLDYQGTQTLVTVMGSGPGQQQQSSTSFHTGSWTTPPEIFQTAGGAVLKITTAQGEHFIYIQGGSMQMMGGVPSLSGSQQMQVQQVASIPTSSFPPMAPMKPMSMGGMQMNPMEMRMGDMEMRMGSPTASSKPNTPNPRRFCSQCGTAVEPEDRFCSSCGHRLV